AKRIGLDKFAQLYYLTLTQLLRTSSDFKEARAQTEAACATLFGAGADCAAVSEAFEAVGI
ncbi:MAG: M4 family metallopeptidase, partial [Bdellovibrionota bacterium]